MVMEIIYRLAAFGFRSALKVAAIGSPPQQEDGWPRHQKEAAKPHLNGADGGVVKKFLDHTTPSARTNEAARLFLIVQPPLLLLRRGPQSAPQLDSNAGFPNFSPISLPCT